MAEVGDIYRCRVLCLANDQTGVNVLHYACIGKTGTGATDAQIAIALDTAIAAAYKAIIFNGATYRGVGVQRIKPLPVLLEATTVGNAGIGTSGTPPLAFHSCTLVAWLTGVAGAKGRCRTYLPFPSSTHMTATGQPDAGLQTSAGALADLIRQFGIAGTGGNQNTFQFVLYSRKLGSTTVVTTKAVRTFFKRQKRRTYGNRSDQVPF